MNAKRLLALLLSVVMVCSLFAGCSSSSDEDESSEDASTEEESSEEEEEEESSEEESTDEEEEEEESSGFTVPAYEDIEFQDSLPTNPTQAEDDYYYYDDMTVSYEISILSCNYGTTEPDDDPICEYLNELYNVTLTMESVIQDDLESTLSVMAASSDLPDVFIIYDDGSGFGLTLAEQGLTVDAREMYPYMPQTCKFTTKAMITYSTLSDGTVAFVSRYSVQDSNLWQMALREDWLEELGLEMPTTLEEIQEYAHAVTYDDPDGNGEDDTWFMLGGGGGSSFQMLKGFWTFFGNTEIHEEDGVLVDPMFDGTTEGWITYLSELYNDGVLTPDWFTIDWESAKSYTMNDKIGMVRYPASNLFDEYLEATDYDYAKAASTWTYLEVLPDDALGYANGSMGFSWAVEASVGEDEGKLQRICHILDACCYGGESYFATVAGGGNEVFDDYDDDVREYLDNGYNYCYVADTHPYEYGDSWQFLGYTLIYELCYIPEQETDEDVAAYVDKVNESIALTNSYETYDNDELLAPVSSDIAPDLDDYVLAQEYKFVVGERDLSEWADFQQEYLEQGGSELLAAKAEVLGCELPEEYQ